jgi:hypothetical protein
MIGFFLLYFMLEKPSKLRAVHSLGYMCYADYGAYDRISYNF